MKHIAVVTFSVGLLLSAGVEAATVQTLEPKLAVNKGSGFKTAPRTASVKPGDQVIAMPGGTGRIVYNDGCAVEVNPGKIYTVRKLSPCEAGVWTTADYVIASGAAAGITLGIIALSDDDDNNKKKTKPASP